MNSRLPTLIAASLLTFGIGACADFDRGAATPVPDVIPTDTTGPGDVAGDVPADSTGDLPLEVAVGEFSYAADVHDLLLTACGQCHTSGAPRGLFLTDDPAVDYEGVLKLVNTDDPAASKLLKKGTAEDQHGGGAVLSFGSDDYQAIIDWIADGAFP